MTIFISVVSHHHTENVIVDLKPSALNGDGVVVVIRDNAPDVKLKQYCEKNKLVYLANKREKGFGENNNDTFNYCVNELGLIGTDLFVVLNPDVIVEQHVFFSLQKAMHDNGASLAAPNLFKDRSFNVLESSVRKFPYLWDFAASFLVQSSQTIARREFVTEPMFVDWASGAFLAFSGTLFQNLKGFDPAYYLYCEDVDICWRALHVYGIKTLYVPSVKAVHHGKRQSRTTLSKLLIIHVLSAFRFSYIRIKTALKFNLYPYNK